MDINRLAGDDSDRLFRLSHALEDMRDALVLTSMVLQDIQFVLDSEARIAAERRSLELIEKTKADDGESKKE